MAMRGVGGPLLCIGDLLSDLGEDGNGSDDYSSSGGDLKSPRSPESSPSFNPSDLPKLFQENYEKLNNALAGTNHSWTDFTLEALEKMINRRDLDIAAAKAIQSSLKGKGPSDAENHLPN